MRHAKKFHREPPAVAAPKTARIFGRRPVLEALHARRRAFVKLLLQTGTEGDAVNDIVRLSRELHITVEWVDSSQLDRFSSGGHHQGVGAELSATTSWELDDFLNPGGPIGDGPAVLVALDELQDPQNVGAILRSAGFFGVSGILLPRWRTAPVEDSAWRVSAGAAEHLTFVRVTNLAEAINTVKEAGFEVLGADMDGTPLESQAISPRTLLVLGNEGKGIRRLVKERCDRIVGIPGRSPVGSLNVGAAAAILLHGITKNLPRIAALPKA